MIVAEGQKVEDRNRQMYDTPPLKSSATVVLGFEKLTYAQRTENPVPVP
ncbi:hypothetical protein GGQ12_002602 [Salinibacter ruber]|nr:hypothetical protein [Salinibacter ruber]